MTSFIDEFGELCFQRADHLAVGLAQELPVGPIKKAVSGGGRGKITIDRGHVLKDTTNHGLCERATTP